MVELPEGTLARSETAPGDRYDLNMELDEETKKVWDGIYRKGEVENIAVPMGEK